MPSKQEYVAYARQMATEYGINPDVFVRQMHQESGFNPSAKSGAGAYGIAQFMPATAKEWGVDRNDPFSSLRGAARFMAHNLKVNGGSYEKALAAYNAGQGNVKRWQNIKETRNYVNTILGGKSTPTYAGSPDKYVPRTYTGSPDKYVPPQEASMPVVPVAQPYQFAGIQQIDSSTQDYAPQQASVGFAGLPTIDTAWQPVPMIQGLPNIYG